MGDRPEMRHRLMLHPKRVPTADHLPGTVWLGLGLPVWIARHRPDGGNVDRVFIDPIRNHCALIHTHAAGRIGGSASLLAEQLGLGPALRRVAPVELRLVEDRGYVEMPLDQRALVSVEPVPVD